MCVCVCVCVYAHMHVCTVHPIKYKTSNTPYFLFTDNAYTVISAANDIMTVIMSNTYTARHLIICIENKIEGLSGISGS